MQKSIDKKLLFYYNKNILKNKCSQINNIETKERLEKSMKNLKIVNMKKFVRSISILMLIVLGIIFLSTKTSLSHNENSQMNYDTLIVMQGDTLWQIALNQQEENSYYENKDVRDIIEHIKKTNRTTK